LPMGGPEGGRFHAHGVGTEDVDMINVKRYFQQAEDGLRQRLAGERVPLILACVEYLAPIYREVSTYRFILEEIIDGTRFALQLIALVYPAGNAPVGAIRLQPARAGGA
jgi:hypothetical protein